MNLDFDLRSGIVHHLFDLDLTGVVRFDDRFDQGSSGDAERNVADDEHLLVLFLDFGTYPYFPPAMAVVVVGNVYQPACKKVGENGHVFALENADGCFDELAEIVREYFGRQTYRNTFYAQ